MECIVSWAPQPISQQKFGVIFMIELFVIFVIELFVIFVNKCGLHCHLRD